MENYYKILEVDKDASPETIEKVYKMLVKKYHPDLQNDKDKIEAEDKIKKINEAYDILSNPIKREEYNNELTDNNISFEQYNSILNENIALKKELEYIQNKINIIQSKLINNYSTENYRQNLNSQTNYTNTRDNTDDFYNPKNFTTKSPTKKHTKISQFIKTLFRILLTVAIAIIILKIPFVSSLIFNVFYLDHSKILLIIIISIIIFTKNS